MARKENEVVPISAGPWGGQYGCRWDDGAYCTIRQVVIASSAVIDSVRFEYDNKGVSVWSEKHGGSGGKLDKIKLDYPNEYLVSISGHCGSISELEPAVVRSLFFQSNKKKYGPFGIPQGTSFSLPISGGKLVGFHGRSSWHLDSIGVYVKPHLQQTPSTVTPGATSVNNGNSEAMNETKVVSYGPWGGKGGMIFDDGIHTGVREIHLTRSGGLVSIQVCYDQNTRAVWGDKNGGTGGLTKDKIAFDYPSEWLTQITGYYASTILRGPTIVKSITFHTNKKSYGPFGDQQGISFSSGSKQGVIVGFHGRKGYFIDSIGVHVMKPKPFLPANPSNMIGQKTSEVVPVPVARKSGPPEPVSWDRDGGKPKEIGFREPLPWGREGSKPKETGFREQVPWGRDGGKQRETGFRDLEPRETGSYEPVSWGQNGGKQREASSYELNYLGRVGEKPRETSSREVGPWGGDGGKPWDDGAYTGIRKIILTTGEGICSIQIEYDRNGQSVWSAQHGHGNNACTYIVKFGYPHEMLTSVSGYFGFVAGGASRVVKSLTFYTNVATYGPFGEEAGNYFSLGKMGGKVVGFHGRSGDYLDAIGVHMQQQQQQQPKQLQWMGTENTYQFVVDRQDAMRAVLGKILV